MDISLILEKNSWRRNRDEIKNDENIKEVFSRKHKILYSFVDKESLIIIGPRRVGKTTYFKLLIYDLLINKNINPEDVLYISCEILKDKTDIIEVLRFIKSKYVFLDEITFVDGWEQAIKFALDQELLKGRILYITGSSTAFLRKETFPGRKIKIIPFAPLDFFRFSKIFGTDELAKKLEKFKTIEDLLPYYHEIFDLFLKYMECGGFPKPALQLIEEGRIKEENYDEIYSWFRGDILKLGRSEEISKALISRVLETLTTLVAYNSIGNYIGVSHRIVREYIEELKNLMYADFCYQIDLQKKLPIFRKEKKIYFTDPFVVRTFEKKIIGRRVIDESKMAEMIAFNTLKSINKEVFVIKDNGETDFWVDSKRFEVKWAEKTSSRKNTTILSKKDYNPNTSVFQLPIFILNYLKKNVYNTKD